MNVLKIVLVIFLILCVLISVGLLRYDTDVFAVGGGVVKFINGVGTTAKTIFNLFTPDIGHYYMAIGFDEWTPTYHKAGFVLEFDGDYHSLTNAVSGYENKMWKVVYKGPSPFDEYITFNYVKFDTFHNIKCYADESGNTLVREFDAWFFNSNHYSASGVWVSHTAAYTALNDYIINNKNMPNSTYVQDAPEGGGGHI